MDMPAPPPSAPIGKKRAVLEALFDMIVTRGLEQGDRLPSELDLARELGVGRSTVREALGAWQAMGIVTRNKGAGTVLAAPIQQNAMQLPLSITLEAESLRRTLEVRRPLEIEAVRLAAVRADARARHAITGRMLDLMDIYEAGDDWREADRLFHNAIHQASGNPIFQQMTNQLLAAFHEIYEAPFGQAQLGSETIPFHRDLADGVVGGDAEGAARVMARIMDMVEAATNKMTKGHDHG